MNDLDLITKGFNAGYLLEKHDPALARKLLDNLKDKDLPYAQGFSAGIKEYVREKITERYKEQIYSKDKTKNQDLGRER